MYKVDSAPQGRGAVNGRLAADNAGVLDDTAVAGTWIHPVSRLISSDLPGLVEEAPGVRFSSPHLGQARRGDVAPCPPGDISKEVHGANLIDVLIEVRELLKSRIRKPDGDDL